MALETNAFNHRAHGRAGGLQMIPLPVGSKRREINSPGIHANCVALDLNFSHCGIRAKGARALAERVPGVSDPAFRATVSIIVTSNQHAVKILPNIS